MRIEVLSRLDAKSLPRQIVTQRLVVNTNEQGTGWSSAWQRRVTTSLHNRAIAHAVSHVFLSSVYLGNVDHLDDIASVLDNETDLGSRRQNYMPNERGIKAIKARYLGPLASHYLLSITNLEEPDVQLVSRLAGELYDLAVSERWTRVYQIVIREFCPIRHIRIAA